MNNKEFLIKGAKELHLDLQEDQVKKLLDYKEYVLERNKSMNLTSITEDREFIIKHFFDSFTLNKAHSFKKEEKVLDLGTGAGIPGIPLKILFPDNYFLLADSLNKRIGFLKEVVDKLGLEDVECVHGRAEELGQDQKYREEFDLVLARAVSNLAVLAEYALPFVKKGGRFLCLKGPSYDKELKEGERALKVLGGKLKEVIKIPLPFSDITHYILVIEKISKTPTKYPRKPGKPTKNPIK